MQGWIGTSGYSYQDWVGVFYPPGTRPGAMLPHYCRHFPLVELNFTFYRLPTAAMLARLAEQTPARFQFIVKMPRSLSHEQSPSDIEGFRQAIEALRGRGQLLGLLCQLPQATHRSRKHCDWLALLAREFAGCQLAVEFRHRSWFHPEITAWLREREVDLVSVDVPDLPGLYPRGLVASGPRLYVRFHSRNAANWYGPDKDRYDYHFEDEELSEWIDALMQTADGGQRVLLLFNNCQRTQAAANAQRMRELMSRLAPAIEVVEPFASPSQGVQQRLLFD